MVTPHQDHYILFKLFSVHFGPSSWTTYFCVHDATFLGRYIPVNRATGQNLNSGIICGHGTKRTKQRKPTENPEWRRCPKDPWHFSSWQLHTHCSFYLRLKIPYRNSMHTEAF